MSDPRANRARPPRVGARRFRLTSQSRTSGQALIEYVLIVTLITIAIIAVLAITGPAVGNVFSNAVYNLLEGTVEPREPLEADEFWTQVAAVASYTPENPSLITNTPAPHTSTPTVGPSPTPSPVTPSPEPTGTATPGPSPTPPDQNFGYPFNDDGSDQDNWEFDWDGPIGVWNAEFWDMADADGVSYEPDMSSMPPGSGDWQTTYESLDEYWGDSPGGGVTKSFYARFTNTAMLENMEYTLKLRKDDGARVWIDGVLLYDSWSWSPDRDDWQEIKFTPASTGEIPIVVEMFDNGWGARMSVFIIEPGDMLDEGDCNWRVSDEEFRSPPTAWSDSPGANYDSYSRCILALRGYIDLRGSTRPKLDFWDRYDLEWGAHAIVSVSVAGTGNWTDLEIHHDEINLGWTRESFDLTNFADPDGPGPNLGRDFSNDIIEIRFILDNSGSGNTRDGWWIDDISVTEDLLKRYTVGFSDDMEGGLNWYAGGSWARSNEAVHSGTKAWSDSPGGNYAHGSNNILELDGIVDLDNDAVVDPEVVFWHRFDLERYDSINIEVSTDNRYSWELLTGNPLAYRETNFSWQQSVISLRDYVGQEIFLRFRIDARSHSNVADGWWIDDFSLRNAPDTVITPDWCDNMEVGGGEWVADGTWAVVTGSDHNPTQPRNQTIHPHSGGQFWSDSPGMDYLDDTDSSLMLRAKLDLSANSNPEMVFWHQWDLGYSEDLYVEVSDDDGENWTTVWTYQYNGVPTGYTSVVDHGYNTVLSWTREVINLNAYVGTVIKVRFRLDALYGSSVNDGWWLDDVCFQEHNEPVWRVATMTNGFRDGFELGDNNWYAGGTWIISPENKYEGSVAYTDSFGVNYGHQTNAVLELRGALDFSGMVKPTIYYWDRFSLHYEDYALVEVNVSDDNGATWSGWKELDRRRYETTTSWDRQQVGRAADMTSYIDKLVRFRFRLYAVRDGRTADGWYIDDFWVVERDTRELAHNLSFFEDVETENNYWVMDGTWTRMSVPRVVDSGASLGPGGWAAQYYNDDNRNRSFDAGELDFTQTDAEIDFDWRGGRPAGIDSDNYFLVRWTRTVSVENDDSVYQIQAQSDDGIRVYVDGNLELNRWVDRGFNSTPDTADVTLDQGDHVFVVEYYERTGDARVRVRFAFGGWVFHDSPSGDYFHQNNMSLTLESPIDLSGTSNPTLSYWERRFLGNGDRAYTEVSDDGGFTWSRVRSVSGDDSRWRLRFIDLSRYAGDQINIRFRLDARDNSNVDDGWYIDDILVAE
ncbi:MAG: hypothetical protein GYB65_17565 [Chloroflexi bacterium]|nr:hypothetical protein [Chloroflexota bacterium]